MSDVPRPQDRPSWSTLQAHARELEGTTLRALFAADPERGERLRAEGAGWLLDHSKHRVTDEVLRALCTLARECGVEARRDAMFRGERINTTEDRSVLHVALRAPRGETLEVDGRDVVEPVHAVLDEMADFAERVRRGEWKGFGGYAVRNVVMDSSRHIVSTTVTTFGGFLPLILEGSEFWPPFAMAIAGGVLLSTIISCFLVPPVFLLVTRIGSPSTLMAQAREAVS